MEMMLGITPKGKPQQDARVHALLTADLFAINTDAVRALLPPRSPAHVSLFRDRTWAKTWSRTFRK